MEKLTWNMSVVSLEKGWVVSRAPPFLESKITGKRKVRDVFHGSCLCQHLKEGAESSYFSG